MRHWLPNPTTNRTQSNLFELLRCEGGKDSKNLKGREPASGEDLKKPTGLFILFDLERSLDLFDYISLDNVTDLDIVVALDIKTAVHTHVDFLDIVLESLE